MKRPGMIDGLLLGALLGFIIGVLFAPQSGTETRAWISRARRNRDDMIADTKDAAEKLIQKTRKSIEESLDKLSRSLEQQEELARERTERVHES